MKKERAVADLRPLNRATIPDTYLLSFQQDIINSICGKRYITVVDISNFFFQLPVYLDHYDRFTFISQRRIERSKVVFIRFTNSLFYIQRFIDRTLKTYNDHCRAFIDDVVIFSDTFNDHIEYLEDIFSLFREKNININPEKSYIGYPIVELLRYYIDALGIYSTEDRTQDFRKLEFPFILKALKTYLRATGFLRSMIPYYVQIADTL